MAYQPNLRTCSIIEEKPTKRIIKDTYVRSEEEEENREEAAVSERRASE